MDATDGGESYRKEDWLADARFVTRCRAQAREQGDLKSVKETVSLYFQTLYGSRSAYYQTRLVSALDYLDRHQRTFAETTPDGFRDMREPLLLAMHTIINRVRADQLGSNWHPGEVRELALRLCDTDLILAPNQSPHLGRDARKATSD